MRWGRVVALMVALGAPALGLAKPKGKPPVASEPTGPAAPRLDFAASAYADAVRTPPLDGATSGLDLGSMQRTRVTMKLTLPDVEVEARPELIPALRRVLASDPRWRLSGTPGALVATARVQRDGVWQSAWEGYHAVVGGAWRATVRVGRWPAGSPWATSASVARHPFGARTVELTPFQLAEAPWQGARATALSVDGPGFGFDVYEASADNSRALSTAALERIAEQLSDVSAMADLVVTQGVDGLLPAGEPAEAGAVRLASAGVGQIGVRARVNPGAEGWCWLRLIVDGKPWEESAVMAGTREVVGWSDDPGEGFWMESVFPVATGGGVAGVAEVWFSAGSGAPRRLAQAAVMIPTR